MAHDAELRPVTVDALNTMVQGLRPRIIKQSCYSCDVCEALFPMSCAKRMQWMCLTVFVCNAAPSGDNNTNAMCFDRAPVVYGAFTSLSEDAAEAANVTAAALIVELGQSGKREWYDSDCVTHIALDDVFVREHLGLTAAYIAYIGRPGRPPTALPPVQWRGSFTERDDSTGGILQLTQQRQIDNEVVWWESTALPVPPDDFLRAAVEWAAHLRGFVGDVASRAVGDVRASFEQRIRLTWTPNAKGQLIRCGEESEWVVSYDLSSCRTSTTSIAVNVGGLVVAVADAHARDGSHAPHGIEWLRRFEPMMAWLALYVRKYRSGNPPSPPAHAPSIRAVATAVVLVDCARNITENDIAVLRRRVTCTRPYADSRHAGARPSKMTLVTFMEKRLLVSDTPSTLGLLNMGTDEKSTADPGDAWVRSCLGTLVGLANQAVTLAGLVCIASGLGTDTLIGSWRGRVLVVFDWSNVQYGGFWEKDRQVLNLAAYVRYVDNGSAFWYMLINCLHELGHCCEPPHGTPDHHGKGFRSRTGSMYAELVNGLVAGADGWADLLPPVVSHSGTGGTGHANGAIFCSFLPFAVCHRLFCRRRRVHHPHPSSSPPVMLRSAVVGVR